MTLDDTRRYMQALFTALHAIHSLQIIHRDVKPSNFLHRRGTDEYMLVDFGLAQMVRGAASFSCAVCVGPMSVSVTPYACSM